MKTIFLISLSLLLYFSNSILWGQATPVGNQDDSSVSPVPPCVKLAREKAPAALSPDEKESILLLREEEKLARDLYLSLLEVHGLHNLQNISRSEQVHMNAMLFLIQRYDLQDPAVEERGVFKNKSLEELYIALLEKGKQDRIEALRVGALVEETDIADLKKALDEQVDNEDIRIVYENLMRASHNHLRSFVRLLKANDIEYRPEILGKELFDEIMLKS